MEYKKEINSDLFNDFISLCEKKGFSIKDAVVGNIRKEYIKQKEFNEFVIKQKDDILTFFKGTVVPLADTAENIANDIISLFVKNDFIKEGRASFHEAKLKYPKRLIPLFEYLADHPNDEEKPRKFFYFINERKEKRSYFWLGVAIVGVLSYCLFPLWPLEVKLGIWWVSWILSIVMVS